MPTRIPIPLGLESNPSRHPPAGAQFLLNMRAEITRADSKATVPIALFRNEGIAEWLTGLDGAVRGMRTMQGVLYVVAGTKLYSVDDTPTETELGTVAGTAAVDMAGNGTELVIVNAAGTGYVWNESTDTFVTITDPDFVTAAWVEFLDQFMVFGRLDGDGFFLSALADATDYDALDTASAESAPDDIVMGKVVNRDLLLFGTDTLEVWYNAGLADFPLERAPSGTVEIGCAAKRSVAICDNAATWLGRYRGGLSVRRLEGRTPRRISIPSLDDLFDSFTTVDDAIGQSYTFGGHEFYVLIFPTEERTFAWDATTNLWHERSYEYPGDLISSFVPAAGGTTHGFDDETEWTGDDDLVIDGGVATFEGGTILAIAQINAMLSGDGITWQSAVSGEDSISNGIPAWSDKLGKFWTVTGAAGGSAASSPDGNEWTAVAITGLTDTVEILTWIDDLELFIAGANNSIFTSPDGEAWTERLGPGNLRGLAWNGSIIVGASVNVGGGIDTSPDGTTWTTQTSNFSVNNDVTWFEPAALFISVGGNSGSIETSPDGITWTDRTIPGQAFAFGRVVAGDSAVVAAADSNKVATSPDGITWTLHDGGGWVTAREAHWFNGNFVVIGEKTISGDNAVWTSPDGETWTERSLPSGEEANDWTYLVTGTVAFTPAALTSNTVHFASPGSRYTATAQVSSESPSFGGRVGLTFYDSEGAEISTTYADDYTIDTGGVAEESTVTVTAPANTASVAVTVQANGPATFETSTIIESIGIESIEWRANSIEFAYGKVLVGDGLSGRIGFIDRDVHEEFGEHIPWVTTSSPITKNRRLITFHRVEVEIDAGRSTSDDPRVWLQWSDNDGRTWSKARPRSMGAAGKYKTRLSWIAGGSARSRIYRLFGDDPSPTAIVSAYADIGLGL